MLGVGGKKRGDFRNEGVPYRISSVCHSEIAVVKSLTFNLFMHERIVSLTTHDENSPAKRPSRLNFSACVLQSANF